MAVAYFDCFAGAGGDMIVAALIDAGASLEAIAAEIGKFGLGVELTATPVHRQGLAGLQFQVHEHDGHEGEHEHPHEHPHEEEHPHEHAEEQAGQGREEGPRDAARGLGRDGEGTTRERGGHAHDRHPQRRLSDILSMIDAAGLPGRAAQRAKKVFRRLAEAEANVHGIGIEEVHFHEVGAVDSIVDIVAACVAMELLDIDRVLCSAIPVGSGTVRCEHGLMPVPAPATARLLVGAAIREAPIVGEATTPTAAAVLTALAESFGPAPGMTVSAIGNGAGGRDAGPLPNILRVLLGRADADGQSDTVIELSANLDDCTGEVIGSTIERLLSAGCLDAWATPAVMKKSRPGWVLSALCSPHDVGEAERLILSETTTFGVRRRTCDRTKLVRCHETVETPYGPIRVKVGRLDGRTMTAAAEFDDCRRAAETHHVPVKEVLAAAEALHRRAATQGRP